MTPSSICSGIPPTSPPMNGRAFQIASETVRPKPSRVDFWITHVRVGLERVDLDRADVVEVVEDVYVGVAVRVGDRRVEEVPALGVVACHRPDQRQLHVAERCLTMR